MQFDRTNLLAGMDLQLRRVLLKTGPALAKEFNSSDAPKQEQLMMKPLRRLAEPVSESQLGVALTVAAITMGLMLCAIMWQSTIIGAQRDVIQWMWSAKFGG